jgi:hypothetical protein
MRNHLASYSALLAATALFGCGGGGSSSNVGSTSDASADTSSPTLDASADNSSPTNDGSAANDGSPPSDAGPDGGQLAYYGIVTAAIVPALGNTYSLATSYGAAANYVPPGSTCTGTKAGDCCYVPPPQPTDAGADAGAPPSPPSAGIVTIAAASDAGTLATMTPTSGTYPPATNPPTASVTWNPGDTLSVSATGDQVHPYGGELATGALFSGVNPPLSNTMTISRGQNFAIAWTAEGKQAETVTLVVSATSASGAHGTITCVVPDTQAAVTVSSSLFSHFSAGDYASVQLLRTVVSKAAGDNATIYLQGLVSNNGSGTFL